MTTAFKLGERMRISGTMQYTGQFKDCGTGSVPQAVEFVAIVSRVGEDHILIKDCRQIEQQLKNIRPWKFNLRDGRYIKKSGSCPRWDLEVKVAQHA